MGENRVKKKTHTSRGTLDMGGEAQVRGKGQLSEWYRDKWLWEKTTTKTPEFHSCIAPYTKTIPKKLAT